MKRNEINQVVIAISLAVLLCSMSSHSIKPIFQGFLVVVSLVVLVLTIRKQLL